MTFPYPVQGGAPRPAGQGCLSCVHQTYCPAVYWWKRYGQNGLDEYVGRACISYSSDPSDIVTVVSDSDRAENEYMKNMGIGSEAN